PHARRPRPLRARRPRPRHPAAEDPPLPQTRHLALRVGHRGPPHGGDHPGRDTVAVPLRPPGTSRRQTAAGGRRRYGGRGDQLHLGRPDPVRTDQPPDGPPAHGCPHLGPSCRRAPCPDRAHPHGRRPPGGDRPPVLRHHHRPHRHPHRTRRRRGRHRLAFTVHLVGENRLGPRQQRLYPAALPRPVLRPRNRSPLQLLP